MDLLLTSFEHLHLLKNTRLRPPTTDPRQMSLFKFFFFWKFLRNLLLNVKVEYLVKRIIVGPTVAVTAIWNQ